MLVKIGDDRINLSHVTFIYDEGGICNVYFTNNRESLKFEGEECKQLLAAWDEWAADQANLKESITRYNKLAEDFNAKLQELAQYERELMQKAAMLDAAQSKSAIVPPGGVMLPPGFGRRKR